MLPRNCKSCMQVGAKKVFKVQKLCWNVCLFVYLSVFGRKHRKTRFVENGDEFGERAILCKREVIQLCKIFTLHDKTYSNFRQHTVSCHRVTNVQYWHDIFLQLEMNSFDVMLILGISIALTRLLSSSLSTWEHFVCLALIAVIHHCNTPLRHAEVSDANEKIKRKQSKPLPLTCSPIVFDSNSKQM